MFGFNIKNKSIRAWLAVADNQKGEINHFIFRRAKKFASWLRSLDRFWSDYHEKVSSLTHPPLRFLII
jgi:hypothetical protein